jgi:toxin ParE1/3/4
VKQLKIIITEEALNDLEEIWFYTLQNWSLEQADRYHSLIFKEIEFLTTRPASGKSQDHLRTGYKSSKVNSHIIFYIFNKTEIVIVRILHESMDIPNRLEG